MVEHLQVSSLVPNPNWSRTRLDVEKLAQLVYTMRTSGFDQSLPIKVKSIGDGDYQIVKGHRRVLAVALAKYIEDDDPTIEGIKNILTEMSQNSSDVTVCPVCGTEVSSDGYQFDPDEIPLCENCESPLYDEEGKYLAVTEVKLEFDDAHFVLAYTEFTSNCEATVPALVAEYASDKDMLIDLVSDNRNREDDDIIGLAMALHTLVNQYGANQRELARLGMDASEINFYLAVHSLPDFVVQYIIDGKFARSNAIKIAQVKDPNQKAAICNLLESGPVSTKTLDEWLRRCKEFAVPAPKMTNSPIQANKTTVLAAACNWSLQRDPVRFWQTLMSSGMVDKPDNILEICPELACAVCPLHGKLNSLPTIQLAEPYPCQKTIKSEWCYMHGALVRADARVTIQADVVFDDNTRWFSSVELAKAAYEGIDQPIVEEVASDGKERPIDKQRAEMWAWITRHTQCSGYDHPIASRCAYCAFATDNSPVKSDATAPHCMFAAGRHNLSMYILRDEAGYEIPVCENFTPKSFPIIDGLKTGEMNSELLKLTLDILLTKLETSGHQALKWLTGVPYANEPFGDWARNKLKEAQLSTAQAAKVLEWLTGEVTFKQHGEFTITKPSGVMGVFKRVKP